GLSAMHGLEFPMVHRDVKPDNVMLRASAGEDDAARVVLVDFGLSKRRGMDQTITVGEKFLGTWHYMSPEQARAEKDLDVRADVWAAGVVLFEMLAGRRPFEDCD
ncbi:kinase-like domain-containing protein, partial [Baffinella frigidus]